MISHQVFILRQHALKVLIFSAFLTLGGIAGPASAQVSEPCKGVSDAEKARVAGFIQDQFGLTASSQLRVSEFVPMIGTCFIRFRFVVIGTGQPFDQDFFLSPDRRFVTLELYDTLWASEEKELEAENLLRNVLSSRTPILGNRDAPVMLSVFSDLQCRFCAQQESKVERELLARYGNEVALAFHHLPLKFHDWAKEAASVAICLHETEADFWSFVHWSFENQAVIGQSTIRARIETLPKSSVAKVESCLASDVPQVALDRDLHVSKQLDISSVPTLFVNGKRLNGDVPLATLIAVIDEALASSREKPK